MWLRLALLFFGCLSAQLHAQPAAAPPHGAVLVTLETTEGNIVIELELERAPVTALNFLRYVNQGRFDGAAFYRTMRIGAGSGLIQGGIRDSRRLFPPIRHESTAQTGLNHIAGTISMARLAPGTAQSDFFILLDAAPAYDANPSAQGDNLGFAAFGRVVDGMEVVRRIHQAPTSPTEGEGVMRGQMLAPQIRIISARLSRAEGSARRE